MPSTSDHIALANHNHMVLKLLLAQTKDQYSGPWIATVAFYKAVQIAEAIFGVTKTHSRSHDERIDTIRGAKYGDLFLNFRPLYEASMVARYLIDSGPAKINYLEGKPPLKPRAYSQFDDYMPPEKAKNLVYKRLNVFEQEAAAFFSEDERKSLVRVQSLQAAT